MRDITGGVFAEIKGIGKHLLIPFICILMIFGYVHDIGFLKKFRNLSMYKTSQTTFPDFFYIYKHGGDLYMVSTKEKEELKAQMNMLQNTKNSLLFLADSLNVELVDTQIREMTWKELILKEEFVKKHHKNPITEIVIQKNGNPKTVYQTHMGAQKPRCSTREALIEIIIWKRPQSLN